MTESYAPRNNGGTNGETAVSARESGSAERGKPASRLLAALDEQP